MQEMNPPIIEKYFKFLRANCKKTFSISIVVIVRRYNFQMEQLQDLMTIHGLLKMKFLLTNCAHGIKYITHFGHPSFEHTMGRYNIG